MTPAKIVDRLEAVIGIDGAPRRLATAIERELAEHFGLVPIQASEHAERMCAAVGRIIAERVAESEAAGLSAALVVIGTTSDIVAGFCHVLPTDETGVAVAKQHRVQVGELLKAIRALSFGDFEKFCARVLREIGASFARITPHRADQGIDFYGRLSLGQYQAVPLPFLKLAHDVVLLFAGQAKHYPNRAIGPEIVRELIGAVSLARTKTFSAGETDIFDGLELKPFSPLLTMLFTTGMISAGVIRLAESAGIIARSGEQLAVFLADKGIGMEKVQGGSTTFSNTKFIAWLNGPGAEQVAVKGPTVK
jgi:restriction endonuclease